MTVGSANSRGNNGGVILACSQLKTILSYGLPATRVDPGIMARHPADGRWKGEIISNDSGCRRSGSPLASPGVMVRMSHSTVRPVYFSTNPHCPPASFRTERILVAAKAVRKQDRRIRAFVLGMEDLVGKFLLSNGILERQAVGGFGSERPLLGFDRFPILGRLNEQANHEHDRKLPEPIGSWANQRLAVPECNLEESAWSFRPSRPWETIRRSHR